MSKPTGTERTNPVAQATPNTLISPRDFLFQRIFGPLPAGCLPVAIESFEIIRGTHRCFTFASCHDLHWYGRNIGELGVRSVLCVRCASPAPRTAGTYLRLTVGVPCPTLVSLPSFRHPRWASFYDPLDRPRWRSGCAYSVDVSEVLSGKADLRESCMYPKVKCIEMIYAYYLLYWGARRRPAGTGDS
jgi:hypothetical protein